MVVIIGDRFTWQVRGGWLRLSGDEGVGWERDERDGDEYGCSYSGGDG